MLKILPATQERSADIADLFKANECIEKCSCTWFIQSVNAYHANTVEDNLSLFQGLLASEPAPMGILAYDDSKPVAWCAADPVRAMCGPSALLLIKGETRRKMGEYGLSLVFMFGLSTQRLKP